MTVRFVKLEWHADTQLYLAIAVPIPFKGYLCTKAPGNRESDPRNALAVVQLNVACPYSTGVFLVAFIDKYPVWLIPISVTSWPDRDGNWMAAATWLRQEIIGRNCILQDQDDHRRAPYLPNLRSQQNKIAAHINIANRNMLIARPASERVR